MLVHHARAIVSTASLAIAGAPHASAIRCRKRPNRRRCTGHLELLRQQVPARIHWSCPACGQTGVLSDWKDSEADLSRFESEGAEGRATITVRVEVFEALARRTPLARRYGRILFRARIAEGVVSIPGSLGELNELRDAIAYELNFEQSPARRKRIEEAHRACEQAVEGA